MKQQFIKGICGLVLLGSMLTASAGADLLMLNYSGFFGPISTLGGTAFGQDTAFSFTATFSPDSYVSAGVGEGVFSVTSYSVSINGNTYTGSSPSDLVIMFFDPRAIGMYGIGLESPDITSGYASLYSGATPGFLAESIEPTDFTGYIFSNSGGLQILLEGVTGGLVADDVGAGIFTTSVTIVPEPSTFALLGLGALSFALYRRKRSA